MTDRLVVHVIVGVMGTSFSNVRLVNILRLHFQLYVRMRDVDTNGRTLEMDTSYENEVLEKDREHQLNGT